MSRSQEISQAFGYLTIKEVEALKELAESIPEFGTIVNVGSGSGTSGLCFAEARPNAYRYTIDISSGGPFGGLENERNAFHGTTLRMPVQLQGDSYGIGKNWRGAPIDLLFIDADHSCKGVMGDLRAWLPHMADGGIASFHDYGSNNWPCIKRIIDKTLMISFPLIFCVDTLIAFRMGKNER